MADSPIILYHEEIPLRTRKYIFEVRKSTNGSKYLMLREERQAKGKVRYDQLMVFEDHFVKFFEAFDKAKRKLGITDNQG